MSIDQALAILNGILSAEREAGPVSGLTDLMARRIRRAALKQQLATIDAELQPIRSQIEALPALPPEDQIVWAQGVLALSNLRFLEVDTTSLNEEAEVIRFVLLRGNGDLECDIHIKPSGPISAEITRITGVAPADLERAPDMPTAWPTIKAALRSNFILSYGLDFDRKMLQLAIRRHNLEPVAIIGDDLMAHATSFFGTYRYPKLADLCRRIGHALPEHPAQTALDRAAGQFQVLNAMSNAITDVVQSPAPAPGTGSEEDDLDDLEHPF